MDLIELCNEAKVERCRATRDFRSCARPVQHVLTSCGHASLCAECSQRCDLCPICRIPIRKDGNKIRVRLYYECIGAGLIFKRLDERFQDNDSEEDHIAADVRRLYALFDVALENNLISLICHYVTDVCMDESAVSSDPFVAILLDEVVVKDWCKQTFKKITAELKGIYYLKVEEMKLRLSLLLKFSTQLTGISNVLDVLNSSFKGNLSAQLHDLHQLQESILKIKQHLEIMMWCIRQQFLEKVRSRHANAKAWRSLVRERKAAAIKRAWHNPVNYSAESSGQDGSLFIEDALGNLDAEQGRMEMEEELEVVSLQRDGGSSFLRAKIEGMTGSYPFENLRDAADRLFLHSNSDLVVAKQAIFLYYLFDRHWTLPDDRWKHIVDDFAASFSITRHLLQESLVFYLLDDHSDEALQEACHLLPEICGPETHPKIARVLLERENPDTALMVLRWSGHDSSPQFVSLVQAVTVVRVRVECGLLTEAFTCQRMLCAKVKEKNICGADVDGLDIVKDECKTWSDWMEILVSEICCLCIRGNLVDRMIELPWNTDEEKYLHKCLLESAISDPSTIIGSLLVVFYLQRYRYAEAYQVNLKLQSVEQEFILKSPPGEEILYKMTSASHWRRELVDKCIGLLPEVQQLQIKSQKVSDTTVVSDKEVNQPANSDSPEIQQLKSANSLIQSAVASSLLLRADNTSVSGFESPLSVKGPSFGQSHKKSSSILQERLFTNAGSTPMRQVSLNKNVRFDDISTPRVRQNSPMNGTLFKELGRSSLRLSSSSKLKAKESAKILLDAEENGYKSEFQTSSPPYSRRVMANPASLPYSNVGLFKDSAPDICTNVSGKRGHLDENHGPGRIVTSDDIMDISWSNGENAMNAEDKEMNGGPRWRSDETSDDEDQSADGVIAASHTTPMRVHRRKRVLRR